MYIYIYPSANLHLQLPSSFQPCILNLSTEKDYIFHIEYGYRGKLPSILNVDTEVINYDMPECMCRDVYQLS